MAITKQLLEEFLPYEVIRIIEEYDPIHRILFTKVLHQLKMRAVIGKIASAEDQYFVFNNMIMNTIEYKSGDEKYYYEYKFDISHISFKPATLENGVDFMTPRVAKQIT